MKISSYLYHHIYHTALSLAEWFYPRDELFKALGLKSFKSLIQFCISLVPEQSRSRKKVCEYSNMTMKS